MNDKTILTCAVTGGMMPRDEHPDFPFTISDETSSVCVSVAHTTYWFCKTYGFDLTGFPENFAAAAIKECLSSRDREEYDQKVAAFRRGFAEWEGGKWAAAFDPPPFAPGERIVNQTSGVIGKVLYIRESKLKVQTPGEFYRFGEHAMLPVDLVVNGARTFAR